MLNIVTYKEVYAHISLAVLAVTTTMLLYTNMSISEQYDSIEKIEHFLRELCQ